MWVSGMDSTALCCVIEPSLDNTALCCVIRAQFRQHSSELLCECPVWTAQVCAVFDNAKYICNTISSLTWKCRNGAKQIHSMISAYRLWNNRVLLLHNADCTKQHVKNLGQCFDLGSVTRLLSLSWRIIVMVSRAYFMTLSQPLN